MTFRWPSWALVALGLVFAACGAAEEPGDRFNLRTPGASTGAPLEPTPIPSPPAETPATTPTPTPTPKPVTSAERRVIRGWSEELRHGRVAAAARYFSVPSAVTDDTTNTTILLDSPKAVKEFNGVALPCPAKLKSARRGIEDRFVVGVFAFTASTAAACNAAVGRKFEVTFLIYDEHIARFVRGDLSGSAAAGTPAPGATATPPAGGILAPSTSATPTATATATATATGSATPTATPDLSLR